MAKHMDNKASNQTKYKSNKKSNNIIFLICIIIFIYSTFNIVVWIKSNISRKTTRKRSYFNTTNRRRRKKSDNRF